jgi:vacuolar-type H+-ATPase subunit I/STV1
MRTYSNLLSRIEVLEKRINSLPKKRTKADEADMYAEAEELLRKSREERRKRQEEWEIEYAERRKWIPHTPVVEHVPSEPIPKNATEVRESLDEFETWLGEHDEN